MNYRDSTERHLRSKGAGTEKYIAVNMLSAATCHVGQSLHSLDIKHSSAFGPDEQGGF